MTNEREKHIEIFLNQVKNFNANGLKRAEYIFNPWTTSDESDIEYRESAKIEQFVKF